MRKAVYISGPLTGVEKYWEPFDAAADALRLAGFIPLSPSNLPEGLSPQQYMRIDHAMIDAADAVLVLPGAYRSKGARLEVDYCDYTGKPHFREVDDLVAAMKGGIF